MNRFDAFITKFNFKRVFTVYLIISILAGILSVGFLVYTFRDKLTFMYEYHRISEKIEDNKIQPENLKSELTNLINTSPDMVDALILNEQNQILFSAKDSEFSKKNSFELITSIDGRNRFLTEKENPDIYFRIMKSDKLKMSLAMLGIDDEVKEEFENRYFYESGFNAEKVYLLSFITDRSNGLKIYFISDVQPIAGGKFYVKAIAALAILLFMLYWVLLALWVYAQALKRKLNAAMWGIITLFTNLAGLFVFLIYWQGHQTCYKCGTLQNKSNVYCTFCGVKLGSVCGKCNRAVSGKDNYCKNCGSALSREKGQNE